MRSRKYLAEIMRRDFRSLTPNGTYSCEGGGLGIAGDIPKTLYLNYFTYFETPESALIKGRVTVVCCKSPPGSALQ